jgi:hypothetical protein
MGRTKGSKNKTKKYSGNLKTLALKEIDCKFHSRCGNTVAVDVDCESVWCWKCVQDKVGIDPVQLARMTHTVKEVKPKSEFPKGHHLFKQYVHSDGRVFEKGVENVALRGTLPPTEVKVSVLSKAERRRLRDEKKARKEKRLAKRYEKKMKKMGKV